MIGTLVNVGAVIAGSTIGLLVGMRLPERITKIVFQGIGLFTLGIGFSMAIKTRNFIVMVFAIVLGSITGELIDIDRHLNRFGEWLKGRFRRKPGAQAQAQAENGGGLTAGGSGPWDTIPICTAPDAAPRTELGYVPRSDRFSEGMVTAFLLFCMGSMTVLGAIDEGLGRSPNLLLAKSVLDGFASIALASTLGIGVVFSVIPLLLYQGGLTLFAGSLKSVLSSGGVNEMSAVGGLLLIGLGISILEIKKLKVINMLPALVFAAVLAWVFIR